MRVGIYYDFSFATEPPPDDFWERVRGQVELADSLGYDSLWFRENHFTGVGPGATHVLLANFAKSTRAIRIGSFKALPLDHPVRVAENFALVDLLSGGRLNMGIALGDQREAYRAYGIDWAERESRFWEALEIVRHAWTNDEFQYLGRHYRFPSHLPARPKEPYRRRLQGKVYVPQWERGPEVPDHLTVTPKPLQEPHPPFFVYADDEKILRGAAARGLSCVLPAALGRKALAEVAKKLRRASSRNGRHRSECEIACVRDMALGDAVRGQQKSACLRGSEEEIVAALKALQNETDLNHLIWRIPFPAIEHAQIIDWLRRFASGVQPMVQA